MLSKREIALIAAVLNRAHYDTQETAQQERIEDARVILRRELNLLLTTEYGSLEVQNEARQEYGQPAGF